MPEPEICPYCKKSFPVNVPPEFLREKDLGCVCPMCGHHFELQNGVRLVWVQDSFGVSYTTEVPKYAIIPGSLRFGYYDVV